MGKIPQIKIGADYFRTTVRKESVYPICWRWVKETVQNAYDAGADKIIFRLYEDDKSVEIIDNGCGMDEDVLLDTFLSFGGSQKVSGSIGGFGDAKKIVCFCWDKWEIHTLDNYLNDELMGDHLEKRQLIDGTRIRVWMGDLFSEREVVRYLELCQLSCRVVVEKYHSDNDEKPYETIVPTKLRKSKLIKSIEIGELHSNKSRKDQYGIIVVRLNGLALFYEYVNNVKACMVFELNSDLCSNPKDTSYPLNVTREALTYTHDCLLKSIIYELMSAPERALKSEREKKIVIHKGKGCIQGIAKSQLLEANNVCVAVDSYDSQHGIHTVIGDGKLNIEIDESSSPLNEIFPYDIVIKGKTTKRYDAIKYRKILLAWHKMIQYVCYYNTLNGNDIGLGNYYIGFVFEENVCAQRVSCGDGSVFYLINPSDLSFQDYGWKGMTLEILDRAIHEITHHFVSEHNGTFSEIQTGIRNWCHMYMDDIFNDIGLILKSKEKDLLFNASMDETFSFDE